MVNNNWLDIGVLDDYLEGRLDASTMHKVERISLEDPFVAQALAGLTESKSRTQALSLLQKQLQERVAQKPIQRKMWFLTSHRLSIAATAAVLFITVGVLFWLKEDNRRKQAELASIKSKSVEIKLKPAEGLPNINVDTMAAIAVTKAPIALDKKKVTEAFEKTLDNKLTIAKNRAPKTEIGQGDVVSTLASAPVAETVVASSAVTSQVAVVSARSAKMAMPSKEATAQGDPLIGWKAYALYLVEQNKQYADGSQSVMLSFIVAEDGLPIHIKVEQSVNTALDQEAIRLLKNGSKWVYKEGSPNSYQLKVRF